MGASSPTAWLAQLELMPCLIQPMSEGSGGRRAPVCNSELPETELEASMRWAVKPQALQLLPQGITGCQGVLHLQTGPWSLVSGTMPRIPPPARVWFRSPFPLIDTRSRAAAVGVRGTGRAPRAEVEVSVAPRSPALAPWGTSGWRRRPPSPNEVVRSAPCLPVTRLGTVAPRQSLVVRGLC